MMYHDSSALCTLPGKCTGSFVVLRDDGREDDGKMGCGRGQGTPTATQAGRVESPTKAKILGRIDHAPIVATHALAGRGGELQSFCV